MTTIYKTCEKNTDLELIRAMTTKQCGNCKWWDLSSLEDHYSFAVAACKYPENRLPDSLVTGKTLSYMKHDHGQDCPVFEERKE